MVNNPPPIDPAIFQQLLASGQFQQLNPALQTALNTGNPGPTLDLKNNPFGGVPTTNPVPINTAPSTDPFVGLPPFSKPIDVTSVPSTTPQVVENKPARTPQWLANRGVVVESDITPDMAKKSQQATIDNADLVHGTGKEEGKKIIEKGQGPNTSSSDIAEYNALTSEIGDRVAITNQQAKDTAAQLAAAQARRDKYAGILNQLDGYRTQEVAAHGRANEGTLGQIEQMTQLLENTNEGMSMLEDTMKYHAGQSMVEKQKRLQAVDMAVKDYANAKIDPDQYWKQQGSAAHVLAALSIGVGQFGASLGGGKNMAYEIVSDNINRNLAAQKAEFDKRGNLVGMQNNLYAIASNIATDQREVDLIAQKMAYGQAQREIGILTSKTSLPIVKANGEAAMAAMQEQSKLMDFEHQKLLDNLTMAPSGIGGGSGKGKGKKDDGSVSGVEEDFSESGGGLRLNTGGIVSDNGVYTNPTTGKKVDLRSVELEAGDKKALQDITPAWENLQDTKKIFYDSEGKEKSANAFKILGPTERAAIMGGEGGIKGQAASILAKKYFVDPEAMQNEQVIGNLAANYYRAISGAQVGDKERTFLMNNLFGDGSPEAVKRGLKTIETTLKGKYAGLAQGLPEAQQAKLIWTGQKTGLSDIDATGGVFGKASDPNRMNQEALLQRYNVSAEKLGKPTYKSWDELKSAVDKANKK